jgi:hypothetical protein
VPQTSKTVLALAHVKASTVRKTVAYEFWLYPLLNSSALFDIQDDLTGHSGRDAAYLRTSRPAVASGFVKGFILFRNQEPIRPPVLDFMNLRAKGMPDPFLEEIVDADGHPVGLPVLVNVFYLPSADQPTDRHDGPRERPASFSLHGHAAGQRIARPEDLVTSDIHLFLQSCKNGLRSATVVYVVLKRQFKDLIKKLLSIRHDFPPPSFERYEFPFAQLEPRMQASCPSYFLAAYLMPA